MSYAGAVMAAGSRALTGNSTVVKLRRQPRSQRVVTDTAGIRRWYMIGSFVAGIMATQTFTTRSQDFAVVKWRLYRNPKTRVMADITIIRGQRMVVAFVRAVMTAATNAGNKNSLFMGERRDHRQPLPAVVASLAGVGSGGMPRPFLG